MPARSNADENGWTWDWTTATFILHRIAVLLPFLPHLGMLVRRLAGGGVHDGGEIVALPADALDGLMITNAGDVVSE